tara:strand:+ start:40 stop:219 length:180 start_codon:yes stop_codon:yes gene_type:complete
MGSRIEAIECRLCEAQSMVLAHGLCVRCHERKVKADIQVKVLLRESKKMQEVVKQIAPF